MHPTVTYRWNIKLLDYTLDRDPQVESDTEIMSRSAFCPGVVTLQATENKRPILSASLLALDFGQRFNAQPEDGCPTFVPCNMHSMQKGGCTSLDDAGICAYTETYGTTNNKVQQQMRLIRRISPMVKEIWHSGDAWS